MQRPSMPSANVSRAASQTPRIDRGSLADRANGFDRVGAVSQFNGLERRNNLDRSNLANRGQIADRAAIGTRDRQGSSDLLNRLNAGTFGGLDRVGTLDRGSLDRLGAADRAGAYRANRPVIGGDVNRLDRGRDGVSNFNRGSVDVNNRLRSNNSGNFSRSDWGFGNDRTARQYGNHDWSDRNRSDRDWSDHHRSDHWRDHYVNHHYHDWYHGDWAGYGRNWYPSRGWYGTGWGLGANWYNNGWGYGVTYYNPYYVPVEAPLYDYSLPLVVTSYVPDNLNANLNADVNFDLAPPTPAVPDNVQALQLFDAGTAQLKARRYGEALANFDAALRLTPGDPVIHELRALGLFAQGRYTEAAATLNSLLATAPGMDWTTVSNLYGNIDDYTNQLRRLEVYVRANRSEPSGWFVLAYHYLIIGDNDAAIVALNSVVRLQPNDATARRLLSELTRPTVAAVVPPAPAALQQNAELPLTDLVGSWLAKNGATQIALTVDEKSQFTWTATESGKPVAALQGVLSADQASVALQTSDHGTMAGTVKSISPDQFTFTMQGLPANESGLQFHRAR